MYPVEWWEQKNVFSGIVKNQFFSSSVIFFSAQFIYRIFSLFFQILRKCWIHKTSLKTKRNSFFKIAACTDWNKIIILCYKIQNKMQNCFNFIKNFGFMSSWSSFPWPIFFNDSFFLLFSASWNLIAINLR